MNISSLVLYLRIRPCSEATLHASLKHLTSKNVIAYFPGPSMTKKKITLECLANQERGAGTQKSLRVSKKLNLVIASGKSLRVSKKLNLILYPVMIQIDLGYYFLQNILYPNQGSLFLKHLRFLPLLISSLDLINQYFLFQSSL